MHIALSNSIICFLPSEVIYAIFITYKIHYNAKLIEGIL